MVKTSSCLLAFLVVVACGKSEPDKPAPKVDPKPEVAKPEAPKGLGSIKLPEANVSDPNVLSGGQPSDDHLQQAKDQGIKIVVNLRGEGEKAEYATEQAKVESLGMTYVHIPINGKTGDGLTKENAQKLADLYKDKSSKPMLVHCASGQRVGALFALKAFYVDGAEPDAALKHGREHGLSKPPVEKLVTDVIAKGKG